jgi:hypothetical protein
MADDQPCWMRGEVFPIQGRACRRCPGPCGPPCGGIAKGAAPGIGVGGGGWGVGFMARPPPPSCRAEYTSVTASQMPGVMEQDLHQSEAWLGNHQCLAGVIRAVVAGPPPQAHRRGCGWGGHLARPRRGAGGHVVQRPLVGSVVCAVVVGGGGGCGGLAKYDNFSSHVTFAG